MGFVLRILLDLIQWSKVYTKDKVMDRQRLTIGQMAQLNQVSEQALRLYDRNGLLRPAFTDAVTGYRYYHIGQSARLDLIQYLKASGMTLRQIGSLLNGDAPGKIQSLLAVQLAAIDGEIDRLQKARSAVTRNLENFRRYEALPKDGVPFLQFMEDRYLYPHACKENFFDQDGAGYEYMLRQLKGHLLSNNIPLSYFSNIGTLIRKARLSRGELYSNEVFLFVDGLAVAENVETVPPGMYLCVCSDDFYAEAENAKRLLAEIEARGYHILGDYLCEVIMEFPAEEFHKRHMFYKIQIPVSSGK